MPNSKTPDDPTRFSATSRPRRVLVFLGTAVVAVALVFVSLSLIGRDDVPLAGQQPTPRITVTTIPVTPSDGYTVTRRFVGRVEPARRIDIGFEAAGVVGEIRVDEGARVRQGETVAVLDTRHLEVEQRQLEASRRALQSDLDRARLVLERQTTLERQNFSPDEAVDEARLSVERVDAGIAEIDAALDAVELARDKSVLRAPFDARVGARHVDEGAVMANGHPVLTLFEADDAIVRVGLPPDMARQLDTFDDLRVTDGRRVWPAALQDRRPDLASDTRTIDVRLQFDTSEQVAPDFGQLAELLVDERVDRTGYRVPIDALQEGDRGLWSVLGVLPADAGRGPAEVTREHVELIHGDGSHAYVSADFPESWQLIDQGVHRVVAGQLVSIASVD